MEILNWFFRILISGLILFFLEETLRRSYNRRKRLKTYYNTLWKSAPNLKARELIGSRPFREFYHYRGYIDEKIKKFLNDKANFLIVGEPLSGKSRSIFQALKESSKNCSVLIPSGNDMESVIIPRHLTFWKDKIVVLDDLHDLVEMRNFEKFISEVYEDETLIIGTCRSGKEYERFKNKMSELQLSPSNIFKDNIITFQKISKDKAEELIKQLDLSEEDIQFNGTIGSLFLRLEEMERRYNCLKDKEEPHEVRVLQFLKRLHKCGLYEGFQQFPLDWVRIYANNQKDYDIEGLNWPFVLDRLKREEFIEKFSKKKIKVDEIYLEGVVEDLMRGFLIELMKEMLLIFNDHLEAVFKLGVRSGTYGLSSNKKNELYFKFALDCFDQFLQNKPKHVRAWYNKGLTLYRLKRYEEALKCYDKALEIDSKHVSAWNNKGLTLIDLGRQEEALKCYDKALKLDPKLVQAWNNKGNTLYRLKRCEETLKCYDKALEIDPKHFSAWNNKGLTLTDLGRHEEALKCYDEALEIDPKNVDAWYNKGLTLTDLGRQEEALKCYDKALEINPKHVSAWNNKGLTLIDLSRQEEALKYFDVALEIDPKEISAWNNKGLTLTYLERHEETLKCFDEALEIDPKNVDGWYNKGVDLGNLGRHEEALKCYDKALEIDPKLIQAWYNKGVDLGNLGRHEEALKCFDEALEIDPKHVSAWYNKGLTLTYLGRHEEALKCYDKALEIDPKHVSAWNNKGLTLYRLKRYEEALKCYDKALEIDPELIQAWYNKGVDLGNLGRHEEALKCFDEVLEIDPKNVSAWYNKGVDLGNLGRHEEALECYDKALKLDPKYASAQYNIACIESFKGNLSLAIKNLRNVIEIDETWRDRAKDDKDFDNIKDADEFKDLMNS